MGSNKSTCVTSDPDLICKCEVCGEDMTPREAPITDLADMFAVLEVPAICASCLRCPKCGRGADLMVRYSVAKPGGPTKLIGRDYVITCRPCATFWTGDDRGMVPYIHGLRALRARTKGMKKAIPVRPCGNDDPTAEQCNDCEKTELCDKLTTIAATTAPPSETEEAVDRESDITLN